MNVWWWNPLKAANIANGGSEVESFENVCQGVEAGHLGDHHHHHHEHHHDHDHHEHNHDHDYHGIDDQSWWWTSTSPASWSWPLYDDHEDFDDHLSGALDDGHGGHDNHDAVDGVDDVDGHLSGALDDDRAERLQRRQGVMSFKPGGQIVITTIIIYKYS